MKTKTKIKQKLIVRSDKETTTMKNAIAEAAVINDPHTPVIGLEVITNEPRAVLFFQNLLNQYQIPGHVVVRL